MTWRALSLGCLWLTAGCAAGLVGEDAGPPLHAAAEPLRACSALQAQGPVTTLAKAVERLNALPKPVGAACFVASFPRPLELVSSVSLISAQPAAGRKNPRVFVMGPGLVVSVVPDGAGSQLVEFAEWTDATRTLKGELELPVEAPLPLDAPLTRVQRPEGVTTCGLCHRNETRHATIDGGFVSDAYRPDPTTVVSLAEVRAEHEACGETETSARCLLFHALFDFGEVREGAFAKEVDLFVH